MSPTPTVVAITASHARASTTPHLSLTYALQEMGVLERVAHSGTVCNVDEARSFEFNVAMNLISESEHELRRGLHTHSDVRVTDVL